MRLLERLSHLPFQTKVLIPVLAVLIAMPVVTVTLVDQHVEKRSLLVAEEKLAAAQAVLLNSLEIRDRAQREQFKNAVNEPRFKAVSRLNDADTMQAYLKDLLDEFGNEVKAFLYTPLGAPYSSVSVGKTPKFDLSNFEASTAEGVESALQGHTHTKLYAYSNSAYNALSLPVYLPNASVPMGCLSIAIALDGEAIKDLKSLTNTEIILAIESIPVGSTLPTKTATAAIRSSEQDSLPSNGRVGSTTISAEHYHILSNALPANNEAKIPLQYVLLSSYENELRELQRTRLLLIGISLGGIAISGAIIYLFIRRITMPLRLLKEGADAVGRGDLAHKVDCASNDECGMLAQAFNHMTDNLLTSRSDLETTVVELRKTQGQLLQREVRLKESEEGLRLIIEGARDHAIFTIGDGGQLLRWNSASERILGYTTKEAQQLRYSEVFAAEDADEASRSLLEQARTQGQASYEGWRRRKDGSQFWADVTLSRLGKTEGSQKGGFVEITRDITARKEAETALREARDSAEASDRAKSEFLANMSHEFRTPMNGIIGMAGLLSSLDLTEEQREFTDTIRVSADSLLSIIDDILDIAKIEAGELEVETCAINLLETIEEALFPFQEECEKKALELQLVATNSVPASVITDPNRLRQLMVNLVGNAIKFTHQGGVTVHLDYCNRENSLRIEITDTGVGIPEEKAGSLFDPFFQVQSSASREYGGTGLGLTICRNIVRLLGGEISLQSKLEHGSTFQLELTAPSVETKPPFETFESLRALVLVDDPIAKGGLAAQLTAWGIEAKYIGSAPDAVRKSILERDTHLIIVDQSAARTDTIRVLIDSRGALGSNFPPLIRLVSSNLDSELAGSARCALLPKPTSLRALNRQIGVFRNLLENGEPSCVSAPPLPAVLERSVSQRPATMPVKASNPAREDELFADTHPLRILVVEDNPINTKVLLKILKKLGYDAETAGNGKEGLAAAESTRFDAILMDLQMPIMDGLECARRIVSSETIQHPVFISAFTANARDEDRINCHEAGMHDFVAKPARIPAVQAVLERAFHWISAKSEAAS